MVTVQHEAFESIKEEIKELLADHWQEIALYQDHIKLNPDWKEYARLSAAGALRIFTVRSGEKMVGYFVLVVSQSLHYSDHLFATNDVIYIKPEFRKGTAGWQLIKFAEANLRAEGVTLMTVNTKVHAPFDPLMERLEFDYIERLYAKLLRS
jgi:hypothetical protein